MNRIKVAAIQLGADGSKAQNLEKALRMIDDTVNRHSPLDLIVLPEYCCGEPTPENVGQITEEIPGPFSQAMQEKADRKAIEDIHGGKWSVGLSPGKTDEMKAQMVREREEVIEKRKEHWKKFREENPMTVLKSMEKGYANDNKGGE